MKIALIGDYDAAVTAHRAAPLALEIAASALATRVDVSGINSRGAGSRRLADFDAIWCVPLSPYQNPQAVIDAIRYARESDMVWLGTCAGYQHAVLEYARNHLGLREADSLEDNPHTAMPIITALGCRLSDESDTIDLTSGSRLAEIYQNRRIVEDYNCGYGVNPDYLHEFDGSQMIFCGFDENGEPRAFELSGNRFFIGTAFQPERSALRQQPHPLIVGFLQAALA